MLVPAQQQLPEPPIATTMESSPTSYKKATAALDEAARARLRGPFFGGSAPSSAGQEDVDDDDGLVELVDEFYNGYGEDAAAMESVAPRPAAKSIHVLRAALADAAGDGAAARISAEAERAVVGAGPGVAGGEATRKLVADRLRARGFDAGVCRSSWEKSSSVPAGSHEYVDVVITAGGASTSRYIVEVNIAAEFETARPSAEYRELLLALPTVLVARPETFKEVAAAMCAAAAESIRGAGMHVPPWRRARYVQAKWLGKHKRVAVPVAAPTWVPSEAVEATWVPVAVPPWRRARYVQAKWSGMHKRVAVVAAAAPTWAPWEAGASSTPAAAEARPRRSAPSSGGPKHCGMEMGRREMAFGSSTRPLMFRGL